MELGCFIFGNVFLQVRVDLLEDITNKHIAIIPKNPIGALQDSRLDLLGNNFDIPIGRVPDFKYIHE